jgi:hypothetical protein
MFEGSSLSLYDSANGNTIYADKVVDITTFCSNSKQTVLKYANAERGRIVQICDLYEHGKDLGTVIHYFVDELTPEQFVEELKLRASILGCSANKLTELILENK